jgi:hypothetical protein
MTEEVFYLSVDVESDGPIPGPNSMLSIGAAIFKGLSSREPVATFSANLETLPGAEMDPVTKAEFWDNNPEAWEACREGARDPGDVMTEFTSWIKETCGGPNRATFVGYPATYDFLFTYWYCIRFTGERPFGFTGLDMKTMAMLMMEIPFHRVSKRRMPKKWFEGCKKHNHIAVDDAIEQGVMFINMMRDKAGHSPGVSGFSGGSYGEPPAFSGTSQE